MHSYPSGTPAPPSVEMPVESAAPIASSSISTRSHGNVVASTTVQKAFETGCSCRVRGEANDSSFQKEPTNSFISLAGRSLC